MSNKNVLCFEIFRRGSTNCSVFWSTIWRGRCSFSNAVEISFAGHHVCSFLFVFRFFFNALTSRYSYLWISLRFQFRKFRIWFELAFFIFSGEKFSSVIFFFWQNSLGKKLKLTRTLGELLSKIIIPRREKIGKTSANIFWFVFCI